MCERQVSLLSTWIPKYVTVFDWGIRASFRVRWGQVCLFSVNVTCLHLVSFTLILQLANHFSRDSKWFCRITVALRRHLFRLRMAVSSANVEVVSWMFVGMPDVYSVYRMGPRTLLWGTPALISRSADVEALHLTEKIFYIDRVRGVCAYYWGAMFWSWTWVHRATPCQTLGQYQEI